MHNHYDIKFFEDMQQSFIHTLIWQDETLADYAYSDLTYDANERVHSFVNAFYALSIARSETREELELHGASNTGHDLALQMLGHGAGFWEQESTKHLSQLLQFCLDKKVLTPFVFYYDSDLQKFNWDGV